MGNPPKKSLVWLKHLCLYLKNSEDYGLFYLESEAGTTLPDHWSFPNGLQNRPDRGDYVVEVYSDSNWGGCTVTRSQPLQQLFAMVDVWFIRIPVDRLQLHCRVVRLSH